MASPLPMQSSPSPPTPTTISSHTPLPLPRTSQSGCRNVAGKDALSTQHPSHLPSTSFDLIWLSTLTLFFSPSIFCRFLSLMRILHQALSLRRRDLALHTATNTHLTLNIYNLSLSLSDATFRCHYPAFTIILIITVHSHNPTCTDSSPHPPSLRLTTHIAFYALTSLLLSLPIHHLHTSVTPLQQTFFFIIFSLTFSFSSPRLPVMFLSKELKSSYFFTLFFLFN